MDIASNEAINTVGAQFVDRVLRIAPTIAAFDCDGTLWSGDAGETFFDWEIKRGVVSDEVGRAMRARYAEYKAGKVSEEDMCGEMVTMHKGLSETTMMDVATEFMVRCRRPRSVREDRRRPGLGSYLGRHLRPCLLHQRRILEYSFSHASPRP